MVKMNGLGHQIIIGNEDLSNDVGSLDDCSNASGVQDSTGINVYAMERMKLKADPKMSLTGFFNADRAHPVWSALPNSNVIVSYIAGAIRGNVAASLGAKQINYDHSVDQSGSMTAKIDLEGADGNRLTWGRQLTDGVETVTSSTALTSVDVGAADGGYLTVHVTSLTGTDLTIDLEHSPDNTNWVSTGYSTMVTTADAVRLVIPKSVTVDQYVRVNLTGTFTSVDIAAVYSKGF